MNLQKFFLARHQQESSNADWQLYHLLTRAGYNVNTPSYDFFTWSEHGITKKHSFDSLLLDYNQPVELYGPHHKSLRQSRLDERINKLMVDAGYKEPVIVWHSGVLTKKLQQEILTEIEKVNMK